MTTAVTSSREPAREGDEARRPTTPYRTKTLVRLHRRDISDVWGCEVCGGHDVSILRSAALVSADRHVAWRGLDRVVLDQGADIYQCRTCGTLWRGTKSLGDLERAYRQVPYACDVADELHRRARRDLEHDLPRLRRYGLAPGAQLLEIGSYVGAFLDLARDLGCHVTGIDINVDLTRRCRRRGHDVRLHPFAAAEFAEQQFDGIWILNCFEALDDLHRTVEQARSVLRPGGTLVIRTPNAELVTLAHVDEAMARVRTIADANGLLGMPFRRCLSPRALVDLLGAHGFEIAELCGREFSSACRARSTAMCVTAGRVPPWLEVCAVRSRAA
jgi:SAM-dependent methyltransferase